MFPMWTQVLLGTVSAQAMAAAGGLVPVNLTPHTIVVLE